jgi:hypothetical protein
MFCPECRSEYRAGFTRCAACDVALVADLPALSSDEHVDPGEPVIVFTSSDANEAALVNSLLEASDVETYLLDENLSRIDSPIAMIIGGVKIAVPQHQKDAALEVLTEYRGRAGQDPIRGRVTPFTAASDFESFEQADPESTEEFRCAHCLTLLEPETTVCGKCGREPW